MKGLELCRQYYLECGKPMLEKDFKDIIPHIAVGLTGSGSECYGYDDDLSHDHDFEPGFCIFLPDESIVDEKTAFELEKAYNKLPKKFMGFNRSLIMPAGGNRHGVFRAADYYRERTGSDDGFLTIRQWFTVDDAVLAEAVNGEIFADESGLVSSIRDNLSRMPEDIRLKKLAGNVLAMSQAGEYNYNRCLKRGDTAAAQLAVYEFVKAAMQTVFLLNRKYMPYYKWSFRALRELEKLPLTAEILEYLISSDNSESSITNKQEMINTVISLIRGELWSQKLVGRDNLDLNHMVGELVSRIKDAEIRNLSMMV